MKTRLLRIMCLLSVFALFAACVEPEVEVYGSISGLVKNAYNGELVSGVKVSLSPGGASQITSSDGAFTFEGLDSGEYTISFTKDGFEDESTKVSVKVGIIQNVQILMIPIQPKLAVSTNVLNFAEESTTLSIDILNSGKGLLKWNVSENISWIECSPDKGETEKGKSTLVVTANRSKLEQGNYSESFVIGSNGGSETVIVSISVNGIKLTVEPSELDFGTLINSKQILLTNTGTGSLKYAVSSSKGWLTLSKDSGSISTSDYITAVVSREGLSAGHYDASIVFATNGGEVYVPVKMDVAVNEAPTVTVESVSDIKYNSAILHGTVMSVGSDKISRYGFCWSENATPTIEDNFSNLGDCTAAEAYESIANNLKSETKYYFRAYAENSVGLVYSEITLSFTTNGLPSIPGVATGAVDNITATTARAKGTLTSLGNVEKITHYGHVWGTSAKPTIENAGHSDLGEANATSSFVSDVTGLSSHTTYYIRAYATNEKGTAYGEDVTFVTSKTEAIVSTSEITDIVHNAATCGGVIVDTGGHTIAEKGVCYGTSAMPTIYNSKQTATSEKEDSFSCRISGLEKENVYYVRAYVKTSDGTVFYGDDKQFKTTKEVKLPTLSVVTISNIQTTSATFVGSITSDGNSEITECGFCWSDVAEPTIVDNKVNCDPQSKEMGKNITSLKEGNKYFVRSFAKNAMGYAYSDVISFETLSITAPILSAPTVSNIGKNTADATAIIESDGNSSVLEAGFCWSISPNPTIYDNKLTGSISGKNVSAKLTGLPGLTNIYARAYAINEKGTGYGDSISFKTTDSDVDVWDGTIASRFGGGSGVASDPIIIASASQFALLADQCNKGSTFSGIYFILVVNINLNSIQWKPINGFAGVFNGQYHQIFGLKINGSSSDNVGLFGKCSGELQNLSVEGEVSGNKYVGLVMGYGGICNNIRTYGNVKGKDCVGGICGLCSQLKNSANYASVNAEKNAGGLLGGSGYNTSSNAARHFVYNCINYGEVKAASYSAGIVPFSGGGEIINTCNYANCIFDSGMSMNGIMYGCYYRVIFTNCFWIYDIVNNYGSQTGFTDSLMGSIYNFDKNVVTNCGWFSRSYNSCILRGEENDIVSELNRWVDDNLDYSHWHYEVVDGYARPALDGKWL